LDIDFAQSAERVAMDRKKEFVRLRDVVEYVRENAVLAEPVVVRDRFTLVTISCPVPVWRRDGTRIIKELRQTEVSEWARKYGIPFSLKTGYDVAWGKATKELAKHVWACKRRQRNI